MFRFLFFIPAVEDIKLQTTNFYYVKIFKLQL